MLAKKVKLQKNMMLNRSNIVGGFSANLDSIIIPELIFYYPAM